MVGVKPRTEKISDRAGLDATTADATHRWNQQFVAERLQPVWMADITYCWTAEGGWYLATI
jgi:transposase InsO family protein